LAIYSAPPEAGFQRRRAFNGGGFPLRSNIDNWGLDSSIALRIGDLTVLDSKALYCGKGLFYLQSAQETDTIFMLMLDCLVIPNGSISMISPKLKEVVKACADEFKVKTVWLFGSALEDESKATDIDIAVEGLAPEKFFEFYGRLFFELPKPVDLVDMSQEPPIAVIVREKGVRIYERRK